MDSSPITFEGYMPFASTSSSSSSPYASSSKVRSHTYPADGVNSRDTSEVSGAMMIGDEASCAWSSALSSSARSEPYKAGSSSTWPRYARDNHNAASTSTASEASRSGLSSYSQSGAQWAADPLWRVHQSQPSTNVHTTATSSDGAMFPGQGYPLVPISVVPISDTPQPGAHSVNGSGKGKGKAVEKDEEEGPGIGIAGRIEVWARVMDTSKGRDKVLKCGQYSMRTYLYLLTLILRVRPLPPWFTSNRKRVQQAVSGLSLTRKCLLLLNPLHPISDLLSPRPTTASEIIMHLIDLVSAISDDLFCLSKLGLVSRRLGKRADVWANRLWLLSTIIGLYKLHMTKLPKLRARLRSLPDVGGSNDDIVKQRRDASKSLREAVWADRKYLADLVFVSYDIWDVQYFAEPIKCAAGLLAAYISTSKIYDSEWIASQGK